MNCILKNYTIVKFPVSKPSDKFQVKRFTIFKVMIYIKRKLKHKSLINMNYASWVKLANNSTIQIQSNDCFYICNIILAKGPPICCTWCPGLGNPQPSTKVYWNDLPFKIRNANQNITFPCSVLEVLSIWSWAPSAWRENHLWVFLKLYFTNFHLC